MSASTPGSVQNAICKKRISRCRIFAIALLTLRATWEQRDMAEKLRFVAILYGRRREAAMLLN